MQKDLLASNRGRVADSGLVLGGKGTGMGVEQGRCHGLPLNSSAAGAETSGGSQAAHGT